jgi:hypothetical protein
MTGDLAGNQIIIGVLYLIASVLFILAQVDEFALGPARYLGGRSGHAAAICGTLLHHGIVDYRLIAIAGAGHDHRHSWTRRHDRSPQRTALSHAFGPLRDAGWLS